MIIAIGNVGSTSLKTKIIDIDDRNNIELLGEAALDRINTPGESTFSRKQGTGQKTEEPHCVRSPRG